MRTEHSTALCTTITHRRWQIADHMAWRTPRAEHYNTFSPCPQIQAWKDRSSVCSHLTVSQLLDCHGVLHNAVPRLISDCKYA